jgi:hypothetical protein
MCRVGARARSRKDERDWSMEGLVEEGMKGRMDEWRRLKDERKDLIGA